MSSFTTRVLLRGNPEESEYDTLHKAMVNKGFSKIIESDEGVQYNLPHAEYNISGDYTRSEVLSLAKDAVRSLPSRTAEILVTESNGRTWSNLQRL